MNLSIEMLNLWGHRTGELALSILWQSSLLTALVLGLDFALRRRLRAAVRYALWLVVLAKLVLPPSLALPTGLGWWLPSTSMAAPQHRIAVAAYGAPSIAAPALRADLTVQAPSRDPILPAGWGLIAGSGVTLIFFGLLMSRWRHFAKIVRQTTPASEPIKSILSDACRVAGVKHKVKVRLTSLPMSPCVFGLFRPVILLPRTLAEKLSDKQMQAVLIHELIHLRRGDLWVNCLQVILQIVYWWHPLVWVANAQMRRVREEAVDDAVVVALADDADSYAPTLLEVAKLALVSPLASLGLIGILEFRSSLSRRIERLVNLSIPNQSGLTLLSFLGIAGFAAVAVPMGDAPVTFQPAAPPLIQTDTNRPAATVAPIVEVLTNQAVVQSNTVRAEVAPTNIVNVRLPIMPSVLSNSVVSSDKAAEPLVDRTFTVNPQTFIPNLRSALIAKQQQIVIEVQIIELSNFNPGSEPVDSPLRILPANLISNAPVQETMAITDLRHLFHPPEILRVDTCDNPTVTKILTCEQSQALIEKCKYKAGSDMLCAPTATTIDKRQLRLSVLTIMTTITGVQTNVTLDTNGQPRLSVFFPTAPISVGPVVNILPRVGSDGSTITLSVEGCITEFLGYDEPKTFSKFSVKGATPLKYRQPLPRFRVTQLAAKASVIDGQTLMLGGPVVYDPQKTKETVPVLSEIPLLGALFRSESSTQVKRHLIVLVTPTLIDANGNRLHPDK